MIRLTASAFSSVLASISWRARTDSDCSSTKVQIDRSGGTFCWTTNKQNNQIQAFTLTSIQLNRNSSFSSKSKCICVTIGSGWTTMQKQHYQFCTERFEMDNSRELTKYKHMNFESIPWNWRWTQESRVCFQSLQQPNIVSVAPCELWLSSGGRLHHPTKKEIE